MIEQITGPGSSGIAENSGKPGKQAANGLFAKLMAMLEKTGKAGEKISLLKQPQKQALVHVQQNPSGQHTATPMQKGFIAEVGKMVATGEKKTAHAIEEADGSTAQAVAVHVLTAVTAEKASPITVNIGMKQAGKTGQVSLSDGKAGQISLSDGKAGQVSLSDGKAGQVSLSDGKAGQTPLPGDKDGRAQLIGRKDAESSTADNATKQPVPGSGQLTAKQEQATLQISADKSDIAASGKPIISKGETAQAAVTSTMQHTMPSEQAKVGMTPSNTAELEHAAKQTTATIKGHTAELQSDVKQKVSNDRLTPFSTNLQNAQQHGSSASNQNSGGAPTMSSVIREPAQGDAGTQSGEKGNQDTRGFQLLTADNRANASSSVANNNFQQYLNHKATPTMTMFDSIQHIAQSAKNGQTKLEIQLDPANLGKIRITLQTDVNKQLQIHMIVDQSATRAAIDQQLPALRHALAQQGLDLSGFSMGSHGEQASSGFGDQSSSAAFRQTGNNTESDTLPTVSSRQSASHDSRGLSIHV